MDLVIDERDSNVSSSKSGDDDDQEDDQSSPQPPSNFPPLTSSRSSSYNQHSPDGSATPSGYNLSHQPKSVSIRLLFVLFFCFNIIRYCETMKTYTCFI